MCFFPCMYACDFPKPAVVYRLRIRSVIGRGCLFFLLCAWVTEPLYTIVEDADYHFVSDMSQVRRLCR